MVLYIYSLRCNDNCFHMLIITLRVLFKKPNFSMGELLFIFSSWTSTLKENYYTKTLRFLLNSRLTSPVIPYISLPFITPYLKPDIFLFFSLAS